MQQHYFAGVLGLLTLIMMLNLESWLMRALYLGVMMLCLGFFGLTFGTIILIIFTLTVIFYAAVKSVQDNLPLTSLKCRKQLKRTLSLSA